MIFVCKVFFHQILQTIKFLSLIKSLKSLELIWKYAFSIRQILQFDAAYARECQEHSIPITTASEIQ